MSQQPLAPGPCRLPSTFREPAHTQQRTAAGPQCYPGWLQGWIFSWVMIESKESFRKAAKGLVIGHRIGRQSSSWGSRGRSLVNHLSA